MWTIEEKASDNKSKSQRLFNPKNRDKSLEKEYAVSATSVKILTGVTYV